MVGLGHTEWAKACPRLTWCSRSLTCLSMNILKWSGSQSLFRFKSLIFSSVRYASVLYMRVCSNNLCSSPDNVSCFIFSFFLSILEPGIIHNGTHGIFKADYICLTIHFSKDYCVAILFLQAILEPLFSVYIFIWIYQLDYLLVQYWHTVYNATSPSNHSQRVSKFFSSLLLTGLRLTSVGVRFCT